MRITSLCELNGVSKWIVYEELEFPCTIRIIDRLLSDVILNDASEN